MAHTLHESLSCKRIRISPDRQFHDVQIHLMEWGIPGRLSPSLSFQKFILLNGSERKPHFDKRMRDHFSFQKWM